MRTYIFFSIFCFVIAAASARQVVLRVLKPNGRSFGNRVQVTTKSSSDYRTLGRDGVLWLSVAPDDTVFVRVDRLLGIVPVQQSGEELSVVVRRDEMYNAHTRQPYAVVKLPPFDPNDLTRRPGLEGYSSLYSFVSAHYSSVVIRSGEAYLASNLSEGALSGGPRPMLVVIDGSPVAGFAQANDLVRPSELKSIVIKRSDPIYGIRGYGGIMEITLKTGRDY